jgi:hypothetical protein
MTVDPDWIAAIAGVAQGIGVLPAVVIGALALRGDRNDRKVDRVLALHEELTGELDEVRRAVTTRIAANGKPIAQPLIYKQPGHPTDREIGQLLRFFERVEAVRLAESIHMPLLTELVGRHAAWLDIAILYIADSKSRQALHDFATAANDFAQRNLTNKKYPYLQGWGESRRRDFAPPVLEDYKALCIAKHSTAARWSWLQGIP